ncbi:hypothetical protein VP1G_07038 [Cytospora mali]|uniref:CbbX AAA lid domain-containing protein n=1 Tax=Cytospora mali TaxID=578113 RepID=A0A194V736_CYTMA|nr:hypothetical protein VP1G_07038 [Valsa mali var. pyri (nom. inval.)]
MSPLNQLMGLVGLDEVKKEFFSVRDKVKAAQAREAKISARSLKLDMIITGNPGTGKDTVARLYKQYLRSLGVGRQIVILHVDRPIHLDFFDSSDSDSHQDVYIFVGLRENAKRLFGHSKARGRISRRIDLKDYSENELLSMLVKMLKEDSLKVDGGFNAPATSKKDTTVVTIPNQCYYLTESDFFGAKPMNFYEESEAWKKLEKMAEGKVPIIDEAHMFYHSSNYGTDGSDIFRKGIVDTIVAHVDNEPGNSRCIILMGYQDRMKEFYRNTNPGFQRRFPLEDAFVFDNYDDKALGQILKIMLDHDDIAATDDAKAVAMEILRRERDRPNFGNGGAVRNLLSRAQITYSKRMQRGAARNVHLGDTALPNEDERGQIILEPQDFDPEYDRGLRVKGDCSSLFDNLVGFQDIIATFRGYQKMAVNMRWHGLDPREEIPFSFVFKGPPGTGKTTTARFLR